MYINPKRIILGVLAALSVGATLSWASLTSGTLTLAGVIGGLTVNYQINP